MGIGITNQRETRSSGISDGQAGLQRQYLAVPPLYRRDQTQAEGASEIIRKKTGLSPDAYFCDNQDPWILRNVPGTRVAAARRRANCSSARWILG